MVIKQFGKQHFLHFNLLSLQPKIKHFVSDRAGGVSKGEYYALNVGYKAGDKSGNVDQNREILSISLGVDPALLVFPEQIHSNRVKVLTNTDDVKSPEADALVTNRPGLCIAVMTADCVPLLFYDKAKNVIAAAHAGWRGTAAQIVTTTIREMKNFFDSDPADLLACIGPAISKKNYEVDITVVNKFKEAFSRIDDFIQQKDDNHYLLDLWMANKLLLLNEGVREENIETAGICTFENDAFFSARRQGAKCGRFASGLMIDNDSRIFQK